MSFLQFTFLEISCTNYILHWMYIIKDKTCHWEQYASLRTEQYSRKLHIARNSMFYLICYTKYTLKRISNWPLYKVWYFATYLTSASKVWSLYIVHTNISINGKKRSHIQNCPCGTVGAKIGFVLGLLVHGKAVVESGRNVFLVDCPLLKNITYGVTKHTRTRQSVFIHTKTPSVTIQGNIKSSSYPCQSRYDVGTGLCIMSRG